MDVIEAVLGLLDCVELLRFWRLIVSLLISGLIAFTLYSVLASPFNIGIAIVSGASGLIGGIYLEYKKS